MKVILFDFDGVIVDSFAFCYKIMSTKEPLTQDEYLARFEGNINDATKLITQPKKPFDFYSYYIPELMKCKPHKSVISVIKELARDYVCIIISSTVSEVIKNYLIKYGLQDLFVEILGNDVEKSKTKKIESVLTRYNLHSTETILVTDTLGDIREAEKCSVASIAVTWGFHSAKTLQKGNPFAIVENSTGILASIDSYKVAGLI